MRNSNFLTSVKTLGKISLILFISVTLFSCASSKVKGLWVVDRVHQGSSEKLPKSRWVRFDKKGYQEGGNGWQKHTVGTWKVKGKKLTIVNSNGYYDPYGPYEIEFDKKRMILTRREDDQRVKMFLSEIEEIPMSHRDELLGVWGVKTVLKNGNPANDEFNPYQNGYILIKWDNTFRLHNVPEGGMSGIYRIGGLRDEIELFFNDKTQARQTWKFELEKNNIIFTAVNRKDEVIIKFERLDRIP